MNLASLTLAAQNFCNDNAGSRNAGLYTQALNFAQDQFAIDSKCTFKDMPVQTVVAGQATYPLPADFLWEKIVLVNGLMLPPVSRFELARTNTGSRWDQVTGTPTAYCIDPDVARQDLLLFPIPQANDALAGQNDIQMTYYCLPADMVNPGDVPLNANPLLVQFHLGIAAWAAWYLYQASDPSDVIEAKKRSLLGIYNDYVSQAVDTFKNTVSEPLRMRGVRNYTSDLSGPL
jgi:hypothetical protein